MKKRLRKKQKKAASSGGGMTLLPPPAASSGLVPASPKTPTPVDDRIWTLQMLVDGVPGAFAVAPDGGVAIFDSEQDTRMYCAARQWVAAPSVVSLSEAVASR